ncbi:hypothetical protein NQZ68_014070 [Dissostichus eleginoides]|nr:hypothetical protein NQZ68_014070 [Dissostichus eleginoides]
MSNKASLVAKVGLRLPGSQEHPRAPEPAPCDVLGIPPSLQLHQLPAVRDANRDVKRGLPCEEELRQVQHPLIIPIRSAAAAGVL